MAHQPERLSRWRLPTGGARTFLTCAVVVAVLLGVLNLFMGKSGKATPTTTTEQSAVVQPRPFDATISLVGMVVAGDSIDVTAPFEGRVKSVNFEYGAPVTEGQVLMELDDAELRQRQNEAEAAYLKASQAAADMAGWASGPEMSRARRGATTAQFDLQDTRRKAEETKALLDRGLVPRSEYDGLVQQLRSQQMTLTAAQEDVATTLKRGDGANRRVVAMELENASARLEAVRTQMAGKVMRAPATGVIVHPPVDKGEAQPMHAGLQVSQGQLIGSVARAGGLAVSFELSETDANRVRVGQKVTVTGPGFGGQALAGEIIRVAGEAKGGGASPGGAAVFSAAARIDGLTPEQAATVKIGMSANILVATYHNPSAIVVPPQAVQGTAPAATVMVRGAKGAVPKAVTVQLGQVAPDGVEILSGLKAGDTVVWSQPAPPGTVPQ